MPYSMPFKLQWLLRDELAKRDANRQAQIDLENRRVAALETQNENDRQLKQQVLDAQKATEIKQRGDIAAQELARQNAISNVMSGHMSPTEYSLRYGQNIDVPTQNRRGKQALWSGLQDGGADDGADEDTLVKTRQQIFNTLNSNYNSAVESARVNPKAIDPSMLDPRTGKLMSRDKYIAANMDSVAALVGANTSVNNAEESLAAVQANTRFRDTAEDLNFKHNLGMSQVDAAGRPLPPGQKGFAKYSLTGVDATGAPIINPSAPPATSTVPAATPPAASVAPTSTAPVAPQTQALKPAAGNTVKRVPTTLFGLANKAYELDTKLGNSIIGATKRGVQGFNEFMFGNSDPVGTAMRFYNPLRKPTKTPKK